MADFKRFLPKLLKHEGGFVNDPLDPGGATNKGITLTTFRLLKPTATVADLMNISDQDVFFIYKNWYWDKISANNITHQPLAELIADHAVNAGVTRAVKMLQYLLNTYFQRQLEIDGIMGQKTFSALESAPPALLHSHFLQLRKKYYNYRAGSAAPDADTSFFQNNLRVSPAPSQQKFVRGWLRRADSFPVIGVSIAAVLFAGALMAYLFYIKK